MKYLIFKPRFVPPIQAGRKQQTIRRRRAHAPIVAEEALSLRAWVGRPYRSGMVEIVEPVVCESVRPIFVAVDRAELLAQVRIGGHDLTLLEVRDFVRADGFDGLADFVRYYIASGVLAFEGVLIEWSDTKGTIDERKTRVGRHLETELATDE